MDVLLRQDSRLINSARFVYRQFRDVYRNTRALKNRLLNQLDCPLIILIYHRVADLPADPEMLAVSPENFRRQIELLKRQHPILRFEDDWSGLQEPSVVVTFDDGYADNVQQALPILEELEVPATFFVASGNLGTGREFWWHRLEKVLLREGSFPERFELRDRDCLARWQSETLEQRRILYRQLSQQMRKVAAERQDDWLAQLECWAEWQPETTESNRLMSHDELRRLASSPQATLGAHTVSHAALSYLSEAQQRHEILTSKMELEELIGAEVATFSYPFGRRVEYNETSVRLCREAGFCKVASNFPGQVHRWTDPLQLPRHLVRNWDLRAFAAELKSFWTR